MPFPERRARWIKRATGDRSMAHYISEERGLFRSNATADQVHHIYPESFLLEEGQMDPNNSPAIPLGKEEHVGHGFVPSGNHDGRGRIAGAFEQGHSWHPDVAQAVSEWREGNKRAFAELGKRHKEKARRGERITNTDWATDEWYKQTMQDTLTKYMAAHPEDPPPRVKAHKKFERKHWTDFFFGKRSDPKDE